MAADGADARTGALKSPPRGFGLPHPPAAGSQGLSGCGESPRSREARPGNTGLPVRNLIHFPFHGRGWPGTFVLGVHHFLTGSNVNQRPFLMLDFETPGGGGVERGFPNFKWLCTEGTVPRIGLSSAHVSVEDASH